MDYTYPYPRMLVTVDTIVFLKSPNKPLHVLLIKRGNDPFKNQYALPGGFPEINELLIDAAKRELYEETGLANIELTQIAAFDGINRDPRDRNIAVAFIGYTTPQNSALNPGDDAIDANWFPINNLPPLAFDHGEIIDTAIAVNLRMIQY